MATSVRLRILLLAALLLGGCAGMNGGRSEPKSDAELESTDKAMHIDLIGKMLDQEQYYAALAHIQQQQRSSGNSDQLRYLEAEANRKLGNADAAEKLYRNLLDTRMAGDAYHGLGLLYASRNLGTSIDYLREAARRAPTDSKIRNDLGYALLRAGRYGEAMPELSTAVELDPSSDMARNNLLLLLILKRDEAGVQRIVSEADIPAETVARLRSDAQALQARTAGTGVRK
ncbi:MAG: tetratricopeptide repeat protein [Solimonas sp.]